MEVGEWRVGGGGEGVERLLVRVGRGCCFSGTFGGIVMIVNGGIVNERKNH